MSRKRKSQLSIALTSILRPRSVIKAVIGIFGVPKSIANSARVITRNYTT